MVSVIVLTIIKTSQSKCKSEQQSQTLFMLELVVINAKIQTKISLNTKDQTEPSCRKFKYKQHNRLSQVRASTISRSYLVLVSFFILVLSIEVQRKVEYENFRFKHPSLLAVVIESINSKVINNQRLIGKFFFRFHVSDDLTIGELSEIMKFKINAKINNLSLKLNNRERVVFFNERISVGESTEIQSLYSQKREEDGWLYLDFIIEEGPKH